MRISTFITAVAAVLALGAAETLAHRSERAQIASLRARLSERTYELNRLIFERNLDARERAHAQVAARSMAPAIHGASAPVTRTTDESELAAATLQTLPPEADPLSEGDVGLDTLSLAQGAAALSPSDIDPAHLVNMANIMTGQAVAELTKYQGDRAIRYHNLSPAQGDPLWTLLDAVREAHALKEVVVIGGPGSQDSVSSLMSSLADAGVPTNQVRLQKSAGTQGLVIRLTGNLSGKMKRRGA